VDEKVISGGIQMKSFLVISCFTAVCVTCLWAYPEPAIVPAARDWTLDVVYDQPQQITVKMPGTGQNKRFWYIILTMTNNSDNLDVPFYTDCALMTDTFQVVSAGKGVTQAVFDKIKLRHQGKYPYLEPLEHTDNRVLQGSDNTRDIAIIWPDFDPNAKNVTLFITGLSNETAVIDHPMKTDESGNPLKIYLRKTLALNYSIGGDAKLHATAKLAYKTKKWVMR